MSEPKANTLPTRLEHNIRNKATLNIPNKLFIRSVNPVNNLCTENRLLCVCGSNKSSYTSSRPFIWPFAFALPSPLISNALKASSSFTRELKTACFCSKSSYVIFHSQNFSSVLFSNCICPDHNIQCTPKVFVLQYPYFDNFMNFNQQFV